MQYCPALLQGGLQVAQCLAHLRADIARGHDPSLLIERAGTRGEDQDALTGPGAAGARASGEEPGGADEVYGHGNRVSHSPAAISVGGSSLVADGYASKPRPAR